MSRVTGQRAAILGALVVLSGLISWECVSHADRTVLLVVGALAALAILRYPAFGLMLMMASFLVQASPIYQQYGIFARSYTATDVLGVLVVVGFVAQRAASGRANGGPGWDSARTRLLLGVAAYFAWGVLALAWSPTTLDGAVQYIRHVAESVAILGLAILVLDTPTRVRRAAGMYAIAVTALALYQILIFHQLGGFGATSATIAGQQSYRGGGIGAFNENGLAVMIAGAPCFAYLATQSLSRPLRIILTGITIPPVGLALIILSSREAIIGLVAASAVAFVFTRDLQYRAGLAVLAALAAVSYIGASAANLIPWYFQQRFAQASSSSIGHRLPGWEVGLQLFAQNPLTGLGTGGFQTYIIGYHVNLGVVSAPHSDYVGTLADNGLIGFALLIVMLITLATVIIVKSGRHPAGIIIFAIIAIDMASGSYLQEHWVWVAFAIASAFGLASAAKESRARVPDERPLSSQPAAGSPARAAF